MSINKELFNQLEIIQEDTGRLWAYCVFHKDTVRPNFSISLSDKYLGKYKCWACGKEGWLSKKQIDSLSLSNCAVYEVQKKNLSLRWYKFITNCQENLQRFPLLKIELATQLNVSIKSIDKWDIGFDGQAYTIPMYREDLPEYSSEDGICGVQRRFSGGDKRSISGSRLGYMYPYNVTESTLFICEGFSDAISIWDLGFDSIARPNCHYIDGIVDVLYEIDAIDIPIVIIPDNDEVGIQGANELRKKIQRFIDYDCTVFKFDGAKDIRELIKLKGKAFVKQELMRYV